MHEASAIFRLSTPVQAIAHDADGATVTHTDGQVITARQVVITVPLNTLHQLDATDAEPVDAARVSGARTWKSSTSPGTTGWPTPSPRRPGSSSSLASSPGVTVLQAGTGHAPPAHRRRRDLFHRPESGKPAGLLVGTFASLSLDPAWVTFSVARTSTSWPAICRSRRFSVSVLADGQQHVCSELSKRNADKFQNLDWEVSPHGTPRIRGTLGRIGCTLLHELDGGGHVLVIGRTESDDRRRDRRPAGLPQRPASAASARAPRPERNPGIHRSVGRLSMGRAGRSPR